MTAPWVFFTFFKLYKWHQIVQRINATNGTNRATHHIYNPAIFLFVSFYYYFFVVIFVSTRTYLFSRLIRCLGADFARGDKEKQWSICKSEIRAFLVKICQCLGIFS